jgi:hypothetical protein
VFDLKARIHLHKINIVVRVNDKFYRAGVPVFQCPCSLDRVLSYFFPEFFSCDNRRRFFDKLLVPPLNGTVPLPEMYDISLRITEYLHLYMPHIRDIFLYIELAVAKGGQCFALRHVVHLFEFRLIFCNAHPSPAAARGSLDDHREAYLFRDLQGRFLSNNRPVTAGNNRNPSSLHRLSRLCLVPAEPYGFG